MPSLAQLRSSFSIVDSCDSYTSVHDHSFKAEALTTPAAISSPVMCENKALQAIASIQLRVNNNTKQHARLSSNVVMFCVSLSEPTGRQSLPKSHMSFKVRTQL